eukprot:132334-Chlamydomonas_euryale.AAC.5
MPKNATKSSGESASNARSSAYIPKRAPSYGRSDLSATHRRTWYLYERATACRGGSCERTSRRMWLTNTLNSAGAIMHPCRTPALTVKERPPVTSHSYVRLRARVQILQQLNHVRVHSMQVEYLPQCSQSVPSRALAKSTNANAKVGAPSSGAAGHWWRATAFTQERSVSMASAVPLHFLNPLASWNLGSMCSTVR